MRALLVVIACVSAWGCANPVAPTGGPRDTTPPVLVSSTPETGSVRVADPIVEVTFGEALDPQSAREAVTITPTPDLPPFVEAKGKRLRIDLGELRPNTTYIVTIGTSLRDARSVTLTTPIQLAFSTGDRIDDGELYGVVRSAGDGAPLAGMHVFAFGDTVLTSDRPTADWRPLYRTETDADGMFRLNYLAPSPLFVVAGSDEDGNGRFSQAEVQAVPPAPDLLPRSGADSLAAAPLVWWASSRAVQRARGLRAITRRLLHLRLDGFTTRLPATANWSLTDSSGTRLAFLPYLPADSSDIVALELSTLQTDGRLNLTFDLSGRADTLSTRTTTREDTLGTRLLTPTRAPLRPLVGDTASIRFSRPPSDSLAGTFLVVDTLGAVLNGIDFDRRGATLRFRTQDPFDFVVSRPPPSDSTTLADTLRIRPLGPSALGAVAGRLAVDSTQAECGPIVVEALGPVPRQTTIGSDRTFLLTRLPQGTYRFRVWRDLDGDGRWTPGSLTSYTPAEPLTFPQQTATTRPRWQVDLAEPLSAPPCPTPR